MSPAGGNDPQDRGLPARRHGRQGGLGGLGAGVVVFAGVFIVWARAVHPRPSATPASGGQVFCFDLALIRADLEPIQLCLKRGAIAPHLPTTFGEC